MPLSEYTSVDWANSVVTILQSYMTDQGGGVYELDIDQLRLDLSEVLASSVGIVFDDIHFHATEQIISGITFARGIIFLPPYTFTISPDGGYIVTCTGANHNLQDRYNNTTGPTLLPNLSAGLIREAAASGGLTAEEQAALFKILSNSKLIPGLL